MTNCSHISVENITIKQTDTAIHMSFCTNCVISNNEIINSGGIWTLKCNNNIFESNNLSNNFIHGITLDYGSSNNRLEFNKISNNRNMGVMIEYYSNYNIISKNNLMNNIINAFVIQAFGNQWMDNYWDDWIGINYPLFGSIFPKIILGILIDKTRIPIFNFDWNPVREPYNI
jgi:parallel beta-helix repeat protein